MFGLLACLWLPAGIVAVAAALGGAPFSPDARAWLWLIVVAPGGLPLAEACRRIRVLGYPATAGVSFALLAPVSAVAALGAGLLGLPAILICALLLSAPAWIVYAVLRRSRRRRARRVPGGAR